MQVGCADEWETEHMDFWEDAIKGSSSLQAGLKRRLQDECSCTLGYETVGIYLDLEKFYDSIHWVKVIMFALEFIYKIMLYK